MFPSSSLALPITICNLPLQNFCMVFLYNTHFLTLLCYVCQRLEESKQRKRRGHQQRCLVALETFVGNEALLEHRYFPVNLKGNILVVILLIQKKMEKFSPSILKGLARLQHRLAGLGWRISSLTIGAHMVWCGHSSVWSLVLPPLFVAATCVETNYRYDQQRVRGCVSSHLFLVFSVLVASSEGALSYGRFYITNYYF